MSIGNLKTQGGKGTIWLWQYKMLKGLQGIIDVINSTANGSEYEAKLVNITCTGVPFNGTELYLEVRVWDTVTGGFTDISYYLPGDDTEYPALDFATCTIAYLEAGDATEATLQAILDELELIEAGTAAALGQTDMANSVPVVIASDQTSIPVSAAITYPLGDRSDTQSVSVTIARDEVGIEKTPTMLRAVVGDTIAAGAFSVSFANVGTATATVLGADLEPGETVSFDAGAINNTLGAITYTASATGILLIITLI